MGVVKSKGNYGTLGDSPFQRLLAKHPVAVEKGTKAVISVNFSAYGKRRFNNLRANFVREIPRKEFFNSHSRLH